MSVVAFRSACSGSARAAVISASVFPGRPASAVRTSSTASVTVVSSCLRVLDGLLGLLLELGCLATALARQAGRPRRPRPAPPASPVRDRRRSPRSGPAPPTRRRARHPGRRRLSRAASTSETKPNSFGKALPRNSSGLKFPFAVSATSPIVPLTRESPAISRFGWRKPPALSLPAAGPWPNESFSGVGSSAQTSATFLALWNPFAR